MAMKEMPDVQGTNPPDLSDLSPQPSQPDWVFLGDRSRYTFLNWLFPCEKKPDVSNAPVMVQYGFPFAYDRPKGTDYIHICTPLLRLRMTVYLPPLGASIWESGLSGILNRSPDQLLPPTRYAVFEEVPYGGKDTTELLRKVSKTERELQAVLGIAPGATLDILLVLMDTAPRQGAGNGNRDRIDALRKELTQAWPPYAVVAPRDASECYQVLHWRPPALTVWHRRLQACLAQLRKQVDQLPSEYAWLRMEWSEPGQWLDDQTMDRLFSFQTVQRQTAKPENPPARLSGSSCSSLWDCFATTATRLLFPAKRDSRLRAAVDKLYRDCLRSPLVSWSLDDDVDRLMETLRVGFAAELNQVEAKDNYRKRTRFPAGTAFDRESYLRMMAGNPINAVVRQQIEAFLQKTVLHQLEQALEQQYRALARQAERATAGNAKGRNSSKGKTNQKISGRSNR